MPDDNQQQRRINRRSILLAGTSVMAASALVPAADAQTTSSQSAAPSGNGGKPNIVFILADDIGMWNIGAYHRGMMAGRTPNLDKMAAEGMIFTDYYAEASCTAGRSNFRRCKPAPASISMR